MSSPGTPRISASRAKVIACAAVMEEIRPYLPAGTECCVLDFGLHADPPSLRRVLQQAIDHAAGSADTIILGYGLCSMAVVGLRANGCTLVVPRADDCIAICLGSQEAYKAEFKNEPGTYYLTRGWIEVGESPFSEHEKLVEAFGPQKADRVTGRILKNYKRLAFVDTSRGSAQKYRAYCQMMASRFGLRYAEIPGSERLLRKMVQGPLDRSFVVARPGETISYLDFKRAA
jgi:hypothetical protein